MSATATGREELGPRRELAGVFAVLGVVALAVTIPLGPKPIVVGLGVSMTFFVLCALEARRAVVTWTNSIVVFVMIVWLIPIKGYAIPLDLPFNLEHYRIAILVLTFALVASSLAHQRPLSVGGRGVATIVLFGASLVSLLLNASVIDAVNRENGAAVKAFSYFVSFVLVYLLICSVLDSHETIDTVIRALVVGGAIVAGAAMYEARTRYNVFDHLDEWFPGFEQLPREVSLERGGRLRVLSSSQHPIALAVALMLMIPFAAYLATRAKTVWRSRFWIALTMLIAAAGAATVSRTMFVVVLTMLVVAVWLRRSLTRYWPVLLLVPIVIHFAVPGAIGGVVKAFFPEEGLVSSLQGRAGEGGSGRFADVGPAIDLWSQKPLFGHGLGNVFPSSDGNERPPGQAPLPVIYDNQ